MSNCKQNVNDSTPSNTSSDSSELTESTITLTHSTTTNQTSLQFEGEQLPFRTLLQLLCQATLTIANQLVENVPPVTQEQRNSTPQMPSTYTTEDRQQAVKRTLFDQLNSAFSATLKTFCPEEELRPDISSQLILQQENQLTQEAYRKLSKKTKHKVKQAANKKADQYKQLVFEDLESNDFDEGKPVS